jgi:hypothetical protein
VEKSIFVQHLLTLARQAASMEAVVGVFYSHQSGDAT